MKRVDTIARVRRAFHIQGWSMKKIVRELHVSRNTVRKILRSGETDFSYERERQPMPRLGPWQGQLEQTTHQICRCQRGREEVGAARFKCQWRVKIAQIEVEGAALDQFCQFLIASNTCPIEC